MIESHIVIQRLQDFEGIHELESATEALAQAHAAAADAKRNISATADAVRLAVTETAAKAIQAAEAVEIAITDTAAKAAIADKAVNQVVSTATVTASKATRAVEAVEAAISDTAKNSAAALKVASIAVEAATAVKDAVTEAERVEAAKVASIAAASAETVKAFATAAETAETVRIAIETVTNSGAVAVRAATAAAEATQSVAASSAKALEITNCAAEATETVATFTAKAVNLANLAADTTEALTTPGPEVVPTSGADAALSKTQAVISAESVANSGAEAVKVANRAAETAETVALSGAEAVRIATFAAEAALAAASAAASAALAAKTSSARAETAEAVKAAQTAAETAEAVRAAAEAVAFSAEEALRMASEAVVTVAAAAAAASISLAKASAAVDALKSAIETIAENSSEAVKVAAETTAAAAALAAIDAKAAADMASQFKSQFIAQMSHEIRTPLAIIRGYSEVLTHEEQFPQKKLWLSKIINSSKELELLVNDILDISKVEAGKVEVELKTVELSPIIADVEELLNLKVAEKDIHLEFMIEGSVPSIINTDPLRLKQILLNVIGNAVKFTDKGGVSVRIKLIPTFQEPESFLLAFVISDTGIGMTAQQVERIFDSFSQADSSITRRFGGTGLGLTLSLGLAQLLGGNIVVDKSEMGAGSTFIFTINPGSLRGVAMLQGPDGFHNSLKMESEEAPAVDSLKGMRILLVDDAEDIRALVHHICDFQGAVVSEATNGEEALRLARETNFDLILMDLQMPVMDGNRATQQLRREGNLVPIFALTAHAMMGERERCIATGFTDYLSKPIDIKKLFRLASKYRRSENPSTLTGHGLAQ